MGGLRKLAACCSTAVSITLLLAGSLFLTFVDPGAARTTRSFAYQLSMLLDQSTRRTLRPFSGKPLPKISDPRRVVTRRNLKIRTGTSLPLSFRPCHSTRALVQALLALSAPHTKSPSKEASRSDVVWLFDQQEGPSLFASSDQGATVTGFLISGENTSEQPLTDVEAVLIPDKNAGNFELALGLTNHSPDATFAHHSPRRSIQLSLHALELSNRVVRCLRRKMRWGDFHVSLHACWRTQGSHLVSLAIKTEDGTA